MPDNNTRPADIAEAVRLYEEGWTIARVAEKLGLSFDVTRRLLGDHTTVRGRGGKVDVPAADIAGALRLYEEGWSITRVAEKLGLSRDVTRRLLRQHTTLRGRGRQKNNKHPADIAEAVRLYEEGWTIAQVAKRYNVGFKVMRRLLGDHTTVRGRAGEVHVPAADIAEAVRLYEEGWTIAQVAEKFDLSLDVTRRRLRQHTTLRGRGGHTTNAPAADIAEAVRLYEEGWTIAQVAKRYNVGLKVMRRLLGDHTTVRGRGDSHALTDARARNAIDTRRSAPTPNGDSQ